MQRTGGRQPIQPATPNSASVALLSLQLCGYALWVDRTKLTDELLFEDVATATSFTKHRHARACRRLLAGPNIYICPSGLLNNLRMALGALDRESKLYGFGEMPNLNNPRPFSLTGPAPPMPHTPV
ncbi:hypothetical protein LIA77_10184 [Sarocladium implicatum]|nr:hypothetical protein LIA77_10184 [Sarocladium implicatum]